MEIYLNGQKIEFKAEPDEKVGDIVLSLFRWLENDGGKITGFSINGKSLDDVFETMKDQPYGNINTIYIDYRIEDWILSIWNHENPIELLNGILSTLTEHEEAVKNFAVDVQMDRAREAYQTAADFIREVRRMIMTLSRLLEEGIWKPDDEIESGLTLGSYTDTMSNLLKEMNTALENNDITLTGDLLEYEMLPLIHSLRNYSSER